MITQDDVLRMHERHTTALLSAIMASAIYQKTDIGDKDPKAEFIAIVEECHDYLKKA